MTIGVVIVTYNRLEKLKIALDCFEYQTFLPSNVIVVDNASSDGTVEFLKDWQNKKTSFNKYVFFSEENMGGSGGFQKGLSIALEQDDEWIWISDDDAFPESNALEVARDFLNDNNFKDEKISAICGAVINHGEYDLVHRRNYYNTSPNLVVRKNVPIEEYNKKYFEINAFSYVGTIINRKALLEVGLTKKDYFIWYDDTEHSIRLSKYGKIYCIPKIRVNHDQEVSKSEVSWKSYYGVRNEIDMYKSDFSKSVFFRKCISYLKHGTILYKNYLFGRESKEYVLLYFSAVKDGIFGKLGLHKKYRPGWKPK